MGIEFRHGSYIAKVRLPDSGPTRNVGTYSTRAEARAALDAEYARLADGSSVLLCEATLSTKEYAFELGIPAGTLKRWVFEGMPVERVGGTVRVIRAAADPWVVENHVDSVAFGRDPLLYVARRERDGAFKIGWTNDVERRMRELRVIEHGPVVLRAAFPGDKPDELRLHGRFARARIDGEWFRPVDEIVAFVDGLRGVAS